MSTLLQLRDQVRSRADMTNSEFVSDSELDQYINDSYKELYDLLVLKFDDYFIADPLEFTISTGNTYDLPNDFYKLRGLDRKNGPNDYYELVPFNFHDRNKTGILFHDVRYRILGLKLHITPIDSASGDYRMWYVPKLAKLVLGTDATLPQVEPWEIYIVTDSAIKCLQKEESDVSVLYAQKTELTKRIEEAAENRDAGFPAQITNVYGRGDDTLFPRWRR
jgi:hypothetical protein